MAKKTKGFYKIIDGLSDGYTLDIPPAQFWLILTLEIVVKDDFGHSMLLTYSSYGFKGSDSGAPYPEGYWTPPFKGFPVEQSYASPDTVKAVKDLYANFEKELNQEKEIGGLAYSMGLPSPMISNEGSFIEYRRSARSPDLVKCFKINRFICNELGRTGQRNIADPENRRGYVFLPLDEMESFVAKRYSRKHQRVESLFLSKPIISNVEYIVKNHLDKMKGNALTISSDDFVLSEEGIVICMDIAGYGTACKYATDNMHTFNENGEQSATFFRTSVAFYFYSSLSAIGISQVHVAGDGFIAGMPKRHFPNQKIEMAIKLIIKAYKNIVDKIEEMNSYIKDEDSQMGSRLSIHYGDYKYGRIAQSRSMAADFDGASIIEASRMESGLREFTKGPISTAEATQEDIKKAREYSKKHMIISSTKTENLVGQLSALEEDLKNIGEIDLNIKEFDAKARVYKFEI